MHHALKTYIGAAWGQSYILHTYSLYSVGIYAWCCCYICVYVANSLMPNGEKLSWIFISEEKVLADQSLYEENSESPDSWNTASITHIHVYVYTYIPACMINNGMVYEAYTAPRTDRNAQSLRLGNLSRYVKAVIITHTVKARAVYTAQP